MSKQVPCYVALVIAVVVVLQTGWAQSTESAQPANSEVDQLEWLQGSWSMESGGRRIEEHWIAPRGGTMFGVNRTISKGRTVAFEYMRIQQQEDKVVFFASPGGRCPATRFTMVSASANSVTFENPDHDFPQRVIYRRTTDGHLQGRIEGKVNGEPRSSDWIFQRE